MGLLHHRSLGLVLALSAAAALSAGAASASPKHPLRPVPLPQARPAGHAVHRVIALPPARPVSVPMPRRRPVAARTNLAAYAEAKARQHPAVFAAHPALKPIMRPLTGPFAIAPTTTTSPADVAELKKVIAAARRGHDADADAAEKAIKDPVARVLAEWVILRGDNTTPNFERYAAFIRNHPGWPHVQVFLRRAEDSLWNDHIDNARVLAFFTHHKPVTAKGRFMLARALLAKGERAQAQALVRYAWRREDFSAGVEQEVLQRFGDLLTPEDHRVRMQERFYHNDTAAGMREASRLGGNQLAIGRARTAVIKQLDSAKKLLEDVPVSARQDAGYIFAKVQWLRRHNKAEEAQRLLLTAPQNEASVVDPNRWWLELRVLVRDLIDEHKYHAAYRVARDAVPPRHDNWRVDKYFTAGWIALRFLHDPKTAEKQFAHIAEGTTNPYALGRAGYWQGRAAEAMGKRAEAHAFYREGARYTITYYGQLARARLGIRNLGLIGPPKLSAQERAVLRRLEIVRAVQLLYSLDERNMVASIYASIGLKSTDVAGMSMLAELAEKQGDARAMALLGRLAYARGLAMDYFAYPTVGLPSYKPISPWPVDKAVVYSVARTESNFNQQDISTANAVGLMQVTPEAGRDTARRFHVKYDWKRMKHDPIYNMQMGAAEVANNLHYYRGSFLLTFACYNAGFGRVKQWIAKYGDPREPGVDPVDWAEHIPLAETRNYVQRVLENLQVYRARFGGSSRLLIEADLKRGAE